MRLPCFPGVITILVGKNASQQMRGVASKNMTWDAFLKDLGIVRTPRFTLF